jgi:hypothetical protein
MSSPVNWRLHDLRRTATTGMARLGVAPHVADRVLNHQSGTISGVAAVYNRFQYLKERSDALEVWGRFVEESVYPGRRSKRRRLARSLKIHSPGLAALKPLGPLP